MIGTMPHAVFLRHGEIVVARIGELKREPFVGHCGVLAWWFNGAKLRIARIPRGAL